tara:strand:- start:109 stop:327 length:219 start_codon:yes stop_codon:yes gene_type:complete
MTNDDAMFYQRKIKALNETLTKIKKHCKAEVKINQDEDLHFSEMTDSTGGIFEGRLEFAKGVLDIVKEKHGN